MRKLAFLLSFSILLVSCNKDEEVDPGTAPAMPPGTSMAPNFDDFSGSEGDGGGRQMVVRNWVYAATSVGVYSGILSGALVVPVTAFKLAVNQEATFDTETKLWVWAYDISVPNSGSYSVKLTADVDGSDVTWTGYISKAGGFSDFVWFTGESNFMANAGTWTLYESPEKPNAWLSSEWSKSEVDGVADVTFTVEKPGDSFGSSISYMVDAGAELNRNVTIIDTNTENTIQVLWSAENSNGKIKSQVFFEDNLYHCWDTTLNDVACE
ncbi:MAG: hypothetical protein RIG68_08045 [Imperialibacter sp.]|uniref:hypothetical protein n=1 Tax=Imperialibacter sp. TaxID=2038411 RepID=UPI0032EA9180